jgi:hypothetical protein
MIGLFALILKFSPERLVTDGRCSIILFETPIFFGSLGGGRRRPMGSILVLVDVSQPFILAFSLSQSPLNRASLNFDLSHRHSLF